MSPDLLIKLIVIPVAIIPVIAYVFTATEPDQSVSKPDASAQYRATPDAGGSTSSKSFYNTGRSENGLKADANGASGNANRLSYFDYAPVANLDKEPLFAQLVEGKGSKLSIVNTDFSKGIDGHGNVLVAGGTSIEADGGVFENASLSCQPYSQTQKIQSLSKSKQFNDSTLGSIDQRSDTGKRLVDPQNLNTPSPSNKAQSSELDVADLVDAVVTTQQPPSMEMAIAQTSTLDECFMAKAKIVFDLEQVAIAPIKQMPNLEYYNYSFATSEAKANIDDGSASYFLFRKTEVSPEQAEKRKQLFELSRESISKWNAF